MVEVNAIFKRIEKYIKTDDFMLAASNITIKNAYSNCQNNTFQLLNKFLRDITEEIDTLGTKIISNAEILISVKHQKLLRRCYQIISSFGIASCLIPGLGVSLSKSGTHASIQSLQIKLSDEHKYEILVLCTDFLHRSYSVPVFKNIIITFYLSDYLAALVQLAFAPLKKPGAYSNFIMTQEMYDRLNTDRQKYVHIYEHLVNNCFQPMLMKELLVLQNVTDQKSPLFVKRVIAKEMSRRLTMSGGLLSLIRCFIDTQNGDTRLEWQKVEMICKIISSKHGNMDESEYLTNITLQLKQIFAINNEKYIVTAISCLITLNEKYCNADSVQKLVDEVFKILNYDTLLSKSNLPGTIILTPQEIDHIIQILHIASTCVRQVHIPPILITCDLYILFLMRMKCTNNVMKLKITNIILKALETVEKIEMCTVVKEILFGKIQFGEKNVLVEEHVAGLAVKLVNSHVEYSQDEAVNNFLEIFNANEHNTLTRNIFETCLHIFVDVNNVRLAYNKRETLLGLHEEPMLLTSNDRMYACMLTILSEISTSQKLIRVLKENPLMVIEFVDTILLENIDSLNEECTTIALVLINTILSNTNKTCELNEKLHSLLPKLENMNDCDSEYIKILCKETKALILSEYPKKAVSLFDKALSNVFHNLLPVRAHGIIELTKLIDKRDPETLSKRHYVFCLLQEQLKDSDSYIYLSAINCIASLATHCTSDVFNLLCKEYLSANERDDIVSKETQYEAAGLRMKVGDVIVKVTKKLGEMAVVHKNILLNTVLCVCRDDDPFIRASALCNLAEIALTLNYKMGSIIYEVLLCVSSTIESDKAIECRRAAVMVITSLMKGLGKETLVELKENLLPIYRTLNKLYKNFDEDAVLRLHAQLALEELNDTVQQFLFSELPPERKLSILSEPNDIIFK